MFNAHAHKKRVKQSFDALAEVYDDGLSALLLSLHHKMLEHAQIQESEQVLNVGCGTGMDSFLTAPLLGPKGSVVGIDISPEMIRRASAKAQARGLSNVTFQAMDAEKLSFPANHFHVIVTHWALMLFPNENAALREALRVLKPGGRIVVSVVGRPESSPFLMVPVRVASKRLPRVSMSENAPPTFRFAREGALESALSSAGFASTWSARYASMITVKDADMYWDLFSKSIGGFMYRLSREAREVQAALIDEIKQTVARSATPEGIRLQIESVIAIGHKPAGNDSADVRSQVEGQTLPELLEDARKATAAVGVSQAQQALRDNILIDVRQRDEFARSHITGARNNPARAARGSRDRRAAGYPTSHRLLL
jgi:ubiquinone/menaquinone biosynthesis C-methylase UbiE